MVMHLPCYPVCLHLLWYSLFCVIGHEAFPLTYLFSALRAIRLLKARASVRICGSKPWIHINLLNSASLASLRSKVVFSGSSWKVGMNRACMHVHILFILFNRNISSAWPNSEYQKKWHVDTIVFPSFSPSIGLTKPLADCIVDVESMNIFPVGWCEANAYPLTHVQKTVCECHILMDSFVSEMETYDLSLTFTSSKRKMFKCCKKNGVEFGNING